MPKPTSEPTSESRRPTIGKAGESMADVIEMASLRWQLAESELRSDVAAARRFGLLGGAGLVAAITALPVLTVVLAGQLDLLLANPFPWVTFTAGGLLLIGGLLAAWVGWRRFRGEFLGLRESLDECREDLVWLRDWAEGRS